MNADLELYKIFYTVAVCGSISQAADKLYISQPAVSKSIKKLEGATGVVLFSRSSRGVSLTADGKVFFEYIEKAMKEISIGENILNNIKRREYGVLRIGVSTTLCKHFLIPRLEQFMKAYPKIQIRIINKTTFDTLKLIDEGEIDFGIVSRPFDCSSYNFTRLGDIEDVFVSSKEYLKANNISAPNDIFSNSTLMLLESNNITRKYIDNYFIENNISVKPEIEISSMDFLIDFAKIGLGVTVVIKDFIRKELAEGSLVQIPITPSIPKRTIGMVNHKKLSLSIAAQTFQAFIEDCIDN